MNVQPIETFDKIARLEKLDGINALVAIFTIRNDEQRVAFDHDPYVIAWQQGVEVGEQEHVMYAGSRRWLLPEGWLMDDDGPVKGTDSFGFARWVFENSAELFRMGKGLHYGVWSGQGIWRFTHTRNRL